MFKSGLQFSAHDKFEKQKGKKKKQLSFRDPEVEGPHNSHSNLFDARTCEIRRQDSSLEDLTLEDQALQIAQSIGQAFSELSIRSTLTTHENNLAEKFAESIPDNSLQKSMQLHKFQIFKDQETLKENSPTRLVQSTKHPVIQTNTLEHEPKEHQSGTHHQIQMLKYQLDQQSQQTQTALHQVQLLKDQMEAECVARLKVQNQNLQLMIQNKELLDHIEKLFQQIEDLENHINVLEQERRSRKFSYVQKLKTPVLLGPTLEDKKLNDNQIMQPSEGMSLQDNKITSGSNQRQLIESNINSPISIKKRGSGNIHEISTYIKPNIDKADENTLKISDISPPILSSTLNTFSTGWKSKIQEPIYEPNLEKSTQRTRTNSLSSSVRSKLPDGSRIRTSNSTTICNNFDIPESSYSSSYSDLYNSSIFKSNQPLEIQYPFKNEKKIISNNKSKSKLKQNSSKMLCEQSDLVINDCDPLYLINKEDFKNSPETSLLFNR